MDLLITEQNWEKTQQLGAHSIIIIVSIHLPVLSQFSGTFHKLIVVSVWIRKIMWNGDWPASAFCVTIFDKAVIP